jgi:hypothetical protein
MKKKPTIMGLDWTNFKILANVLYLINSSNLILGSQREKFNSFCPDTLSEFDYELNNEKQTLKIK